MIIEGITRGCGKRQPGGLYVCCGTSPFGRPVEEFLIDPPLPYSGGSFRSPILFEKDSKNHLLLWVGAEYYPWVSDFIEEARLYGVSKRIPKDFPIEKLERGSMMFLVHPGALIENYKELPSPDYCPKNSPSHLSNDEYCLGHIYQVAVPNEPGSYRKIGDTVYRVSPCEVKIPLEFKTGIFAGFPITNFDHVMDHGRVDPVLAEKKTAITLNFVTE